MAKCCGTCGCKLAASVRPQTNQRVSSFLSDQSRLFRLIEEFGSPLNILFPEIISANLGLFRQSMTNRYLAGKVYFTTKPNKSMALLKEVAYKGGSADVSSANALIRALGSGMPGNELHATGPKSLEYISLAIQHDALISIDNFEELSLLKAVALKLRRTPRVLFRLNGFESSYTALPRVLGIEVKEFDSILSTLSPESLFPLQLEGLSYHIFTATNEERLIAFQACLARLIELKQRGFRANVLNIGGGFPIRYAESQEEWQQFIQYLKRSVLGEVTPITWQGSGLGYRLDHGTVAGSPQFLDHCSEPAGPQSFAAFLDLLCPKFDNQSVASLLLDTGIELHVEPGRAMLDQAGITLSKVLSRKRTKDTEIAILEMNHTHIRSHEQKLLTQPLFFTRSQKKESSGLFLCGNLCTTLDILTYQKVFPETAVATGDVVAFINTAAYLSDFSEAQILEHPLARKVAVSFREASWEWTLDELYSPIYGVKE